MKIVRKVTAVVSSLALVFTLTIGTFEVNAQPNPNGGDCWFDMINCCDTGGSDLCGMGICAGC